MTEINRTEYHKFLLKYVLDDPDATGYACNGNARIAIEAALKDLGIKGSIFEVITHLEKNSSASYSYVVLETQLPEDLALNQQAGTILRNVAYVKKNGKDITAKILGADWSELR